MVALKYFAATGIKSVLDHRDSQKKKLIPLCIFISVSFELSLYSWIAGLDDNILTVDLAVSSESGSYIHIECQNKNVIEESRSFEW